MKGCVFKRRLKTGRVVWAFSVDVEKEDSGRRRRVYKSGFLFQRDAEAARQRVLHELAEGLVARPDPRTLAQFFDQWFAEYAEYKCTPKTVERYRELANHIPAIPPSAAGSRKMETAR